MSGIPLPALDLQLPSPRDPLDEFSRAAALKGQLQQQQAVQQEMAAKQQEMAMHQRQMQDQDALTKAMTAYDPSKNKPEDIPKLILQHGGSGAAAQAAFEHNLNTKKLLLDADKEQFDMLAKKHDAARGLLQTTDDVPDDQLSQHLLSLVPKVQELDPEHVQSVQALAQMPPQQARAALKLIEKGLMIGSQQQAQANQERELSSKEWKEAGPGLLINTRIGEQKGTLRQPVDQQELTDYLQKNPGKGPSDFAAWKAKLTPNAVIMGNQLGPSGQGSALDQQAELYSKTHELPAGFSRSPGTLAAIVKRAAELHPDADLASNQATFKADSAALKQVQTQFDKMTAFEGTALKNLDLYGQKAKAIPDLGAKFANVPLRMITGQMIGTQAMAELEAARQTASSEVAKVLSSSTGAGVLSDSQKKEAENVINGNYPLAATLGVIQTLKQDMANRHQSYQQDVDAIKGRLGATPSTQASGGTIRARDPQGKLHEAPAGTTLPQGWKLEQ